MPVGQFGATEPCLFRDRFAKVITPATEVTNVAAKAAGATSAGLRPDPIKTGDRIEPPPIPWLPPTEPTAAASMASTETGTGRAGGPAHGPGLAG